MRKHGSAGGYLQTEGEIRGLEASHAKRFEVLQRNSSPRQHGTMLRKTMPCGKDLRSRTHRAVRPHINCHLVFQQRTTRSLSVCLSLGGYRSDHARETELFRTFALESWLYGHRRSSSGPGLGPDDLAAKGSSSSAPYGAQSKAVGTANRECGPVSTRGSPITDINVLLSRTGIERGCRPASRCLTRLRMLSTTMAEKVVTTNLDGGWSSTSPFNSLLAKHMPNACIGKIRR
jgi:hypothetical protein